jgi:hypothetical protein
MEWIFPVHMNEKKKIREIETCFAPVKGKIHSILLGTSASSKALEPWNN